MEKTHWMRIADQKLKNASGKLEDSNKNDPK